MCYQSCCCCSESDLSHRMKENKAWKRSSLSMLPLAAVMCSTTAIVTHLNQWPLSSRSRQSSSMRNSGEKEPDKKLNQQFFFFPPFVLWRTAAVSHCQLHTRFITITQQWFQWWPYWNHSSPVCICVDTDWFTSDQRRRREMGLGWPFEHEWGKCVACFNDDFVVSGLLWGPLQALCLILTAIVKEWRAAFLYAFTVLM